MKIKLLQLRSDGYPKYNAHPRLCLAMVHSNNWVDITSAIPYADQTTHPFPLRCYSTRITSPLYYHSMNIYYDLYPVDTDVSNFIVTAYQVEIILRLATKPEMGWYAHDMSELQYLNHTIGFTGPKFHRITRQVTNWTQQLYKDINALEEAQQLHYPQPSTSLVRNTVSDTMKICPFYR